MTCHCLLANEKPVFGRTIIAQALGRSKYPLKVGPKPPKCPYIFNAKKKNPLRGHQDAIFPGPFRHQNAFTSILIGLKISNAHPRSKSFPVTQVIFRPKKTIFYHPPVKKAAPNEPPQNPRSNDIPQPTPTSNGVTQNRRLTTCHPPCQPKKSPAARLRIWTRTYTD